MPGIFYTKPSPESENYKKSGDLVNKGDILCLIEVMKTFNQIESEQRGIFISYQAENGQLVTIGQVIAVVQTEAI